MTINQSGGNKPITSTFMVTLPGAPPPAPAKDSNTTAIVLGVLGAVVGVGLIGGVAWYVMKGRQDKDVDPYGDDATTGLTGNQEHA